MSMTDEKTLKEKLELLHQFENALTTNIHSAIMKTFQETESVEDIIDEKDWTYALKCANKIIYSFEVTDYITKTFINGESDD